MSIIIDQVDLQTHDDHCQLRLSELEKFKDGSGYTCKLTVRSGDFACIERPFYFDDSHFPDAIRALRLMDEGKPAKAVIKGQWEPDYISLESNDMGRVFVQGEIHEHSHLPQTLIFAFDTDQTVLSSFIRDLSPLLSA